MESTITGVVESVTGRETSKGVIHDILIGTQKVSAWADSGLGEQANALKGSTVEATVEIKQNGQYTNYNLKALKLTDAAPQQQPVAGHATGGNIAVAPAKKGWSDEDTARVTKLSCLSTAFQYAGAIGESETFALNLAPRLYRIATGATEEQPEPVAVGAEPAVVDDDIPW